MTTMTGSSPPSSQYFASGAHFGSERARLDLLEARSDPVTFERLRATGISPGWHCLEVGAGGGSVARWLADQVGASGRVVATDIDTRFLAQLRSPIEIRRHDILTDPVESDAFDLVHCRSLLAHLPDPGSALTRMAQALRAGGWLVAEQNDYSALRAADHDARSARWDRAAAAVLSLAESHNLFVADLGRRLLGLVEQTGLTIIAQDGRTSVERGADRVAQFFKQSCGYLAGLAAVSRAEAELDALFAGLDDPSFEFVDALNFGVSARRPPREVPDVRGS
jgi:SAM-dependent methyltransferase